MLGVPRELIEHILNVHPQAVPKKQHLRRFAHDKCEAIKWEIAKLLTAGFIKEVIHPEWVANPVLVRKKNNEWRMCVDYTDLNKHCPKDHFGLPRIDQVIDSTAGCVLLCFLDCYSGYHQTALKEEDQIKTSFITPFGTYAYKTMSFGFKNVGATYQRAIQMCFADQLHRNVEAYVDDVVIKTRKPDDLIADLEETFSSLRRFWWKLNPTKCIFGVPSGKLLRFIVSNQGIKANPIKIMAITAMGAPATIKDVQKLTGCMAALNRFISRLGVRGLPFLKLLKHQDKFQWMEEVERALQDLKHHLQSPPVLTAPLPEEDLVLYIAATTHVVSSAIVVEHSKEGHAFGVRGPCTSSVRYSPNPRYDTRQFRNSYMQFRLHRESCAITSTSTRSL
jgi:hypothetical protein